MEVADEAARCPVRGDRVAVRGLPGRGGPQASVLGASGEEHRRSPLGGRRAHRGLPRGGSAAPSDLGETREEHRRSPLGGHRAHCGLPRRGGTAHPVPLMARPKALVATALLGAAAALVLDQSTKTAIRAAMEICPDDPLATCQRIGLVGPLGLLRSVNDGSAFGLSGGASLLPLVVVSVVLLSAQAGIGRPTRLLALAIGLQLGGLAANLLDRIVFAGVTDFLPLQLGAGYAGPVANVADLAMVLGGVLGARALTRSVDGTRIVGRGHRATAERV